MKEYQSVELTVMNINERDVIVTSGAADGSFDLPGDKV